MQDSTLLKTALFFSVAGIIVLYIFSMQLEVKKLDYSDKPGDQVKLVGTVESVNNYGNVTIMNVNAKRSIKVVVFDKVKVPGEKVEVVGKLQKYEGEREVIAKSINAVS